MAHARQVFGAGHLRGPPLLSVFDIALKIKGPDNPTSQLLPKMSFNGFSGDREGRKDKGGGERLHVKICEKIVCMDVCMYVL